MSELPNLFDPKGVFTPLDDAAIAGLNELEAAAYLAVRDTSSVLMAADEALKLSQEKLTKGIAVKHAAEEYLADNFPPLTHFDLWKQTRRGANQ